MKNVIIAATLLLATQVSLAQLSTKVSGTLRSYQYTADQAGLTLTVKGDAAEVLYKSIQANNGVVDSENHSIKEGKLVTNMYIIYSKSIACQKNVTDLAPIKKQSIKIEYSCELDISKDGNVKVPARG